MTTISESVNLDRHLFLRSVVDYVNDTYSAFGQDITTRILRYVNSDEFNDEVDKLSSECPESVAVECAIDQYAETLI